MDPNTAHALTEIFGPALGVLSLGLIPAVIIYLNKHFKLRTRELELEAEFHGREIQARLAAMETRQLALETALSSLVQGLSQGHELPPADVQQLPAQLSVAKPRT